jgi:hypothetical protein
MQMRTARIGGALLSLGIGLGACGDDKPQADPGKPGPTASAATAKPSGTATSPQAPASAQTTAAPGGSAAGTAAASASASGTAAAGAGATGDYPTTGLKLLAADCAKPHALLASGPVKLGLEFPWPLPRQAFLAHPAFKIVKREPTAPGEVRLGTHEVKDGYALVALCKDAETCNKAAAMYKGVIRSSSPQLFCGTVPGVTAEPKDSGFEWAADPAANLPKADETVSVCARLDACWIATDHNAPGDPFLECQKAPQTFKLACAQQTACPDVVKCMGK